MYLSFLGSGVKSACTYIYPLGWNIRKSENYLLLSYWNICVLKHSSGITPLGINTLKKRWTQWWRNPWEPPSDRWPAACQGFRTGSVGKTRRSGGRARPVATVRPHTTPPGLGPTKQNCTGKGKCWTTINYQFIVHYSTNWWYVVKRNLNLFEQEIEASEVCAEECGESSGESALQKSTSLLKGELFAFKIDF